MLRSLRGLTAIGATFLLPLASYAAEAHAKGGVVFLNCVPILQIKAGLDSARLVSEAAAVAKKLRSVDDDAEVRTRTVGRSREIWVGSLVPIIVTPEEATQHATTVDRLAENWASSIRDALSLPPMKFSTDFFRVPLGTVKEAGLVGSLALNAIVSSTNDAVVRVKRTDSGIELRCVGAGDAQVKAVSGYAMRTLNVSVRPFAANFPQAFVAEVTGSPASESVVRGAVETCVKTRVTCLPTATYSFQPIQTEPISTGSSKTYTVWMRLRAPEAFDSVGNVVVTVHNVPMPRVRDTALWYSNAPESVRQVGPLFSSSLKRGQPIRFLYHHINASTQPMILRVEAINDSDQAAKVVVTPGDSKPDRNPVRAGMTAACQFIGSWKSDSGEVVSMPPHTTIPISIRRLSPSETMSGLCKLRLIDGPAELQVRTDALPAFDLQGSWYDASLSSTPWREAGAHPINDYDRALSEPSLHVYPDPYKNEHIEYTVGGRYGFLLLGQKPISGEDHTNNLDGNFGVIYMITAVLKNPTDSPTDVDLVFEASAGYMGGIFLVDNSFIQTPLLTPKSETRLGRFHLPPGANRTLDIITLPVSGGSYPATLYLRPVEGSVKALERSNVRRKMKK